MNAWWGRGSRERGRRRWGNKPGIEAAFRPPEEKLAFPLLVDGEADLPGVHARPLPEVVSTLTQHETWDAVAESLPDRPTAGLD